MVRLSFFDNIMRLIIKFILPKIPFAVTSLIATITDYGIYLFLVFNLFSPTFSNIISSSTGMIINFLMQKKYVFLLMRKTIYAFILSILFSLIGILISTTLISLLSQNIFFNSNQYITKIVVIAINFLYNYYSKKLAFEKQLNLIEKNPSKLNIWVNSKKVEK